MRNKHTLSYYRLLTGDMGRLYPIGLVEVLPGDAFQHSTSVFMRFSPMAAPVMHPVTVRVHHFFVPHRLVWPESEGGGWEQFITSGPTGADAQTPPTYATTGTASDLWDYFGVPQVVGLNLAAMPVRGFNMIYNEWFRDQDLAAVRLETDVTVPLVAWEKDYYTTARPWEIKGPAITLPVGAQAPIKGLGKINLNYDSNNITLKETGGADRQYASSQEIGDGVANALMHVEEDPLHTGFPGIYADLSAATAVPINDFRRAFALQRYAEARARYGSRYTEYLRYLGVTSSDARLQRPEYLGGGRAQVAISEVLQTANEAASDRFGVGDLYGHGVASMRSNAYRRHFNEHGYQFSLLSVRPKAMYTQGAERHWLRRDREEFWQKELEHIGQQTIFDGEVFVDATPTDLETYATFGYQDRYREYREQESKVAGDFRGTLDYWHLARDFASKPVLNQSFSDCDPSKRIFNVTTDDTLWIAAQHNLVARRLVSRNAGGRIL